MEKRKREKLVNVELVATRVGEHPKGIFRKVGEKFLYSGGTPSWAVPPGEYKAKGIVPMNGDLKPKAAQQAVKDKMSGKDLAG